VAPAPPPESEADEPATALVVVQTLFALALIVVAAHLFVDEIEWLADDVLGIPIGVLALLIAPLAMELPEKFNSVI
jgi:cation:H+ antiporter